MNVLVPLAHGVEEMEAVTLIDVLRRAGWQVTSAAVGSSPVLGSRGVQLVADTAWEAVDPMAFDLLTIPGGAAGAQTLAAHEGVLAAVRAFVRDGRPVAAICAGPTVLHAAGVLAKRQVTSHPSVRAELTEAIVLDDRVVIDRGIMTSQGPGTAVEFALALIGTLDSADRAAEIARGMRVAGS